MAYVYLPPRTTNYFPPGMPYLAGLRGLRGLGDYAADLAAYKLDKLKWDAEKAKYDQAMTAYSAAVQSIEQDYSMAMAAYTSAYNAYVAKYAAAKADNVARSQTIAKGYGLTLPQSYYDAGGCLTQAKHNSYASSCTTVKGIGQLRGLGALGSLSVDCGMSKLPVCNWPSRPKTPVKASYPAKPTLRAAPTPPVAPPAVVTPPIVTSTPIVPGVVTPGDGGASTPSPGPDTSLSPGPDTALTPAPKQAGMLMNGLILVAILGGGYLVYRTVKKPKAAA